VGLSLLLLAGCSTLPEPAAQVRLSELHGAVEAGAVLSSGDVRGDACVLSVVGVLPRGIRAVLVQGGCSARVVSQF